jgi:hypothetical protein
MLSFPEDSKSGVWSDPVLVTDVWLLSAGVDLEPK